MSKSTAKQATLIAQQLGVSNFPSKPVLSDEISRTANSRKVARAISSVINFIVTDAFNLTEEEHIWLGYQLGKILKPLEFIKPNIVLSAVKRELTTNEYSERLYAYKQSADIVIDKTIVRSATIEDWTTVVSSAILSSYPDAKPMIQASVIGSVYGIFAELGLTTDNHTSRQSIYLPNAVRYALNAKR